MPSCTVPACLPAGCIATNKITLNILPRIAGGTVISWQLDKSIAPTPEAVYQVQFGRSGHNFSSDWENVGLPLQDAVSVVDRIQRDVGGTPKTYYRLIISDITGLIASNPVPALTGQLNESQWRLYNEIIRREFRRYTDPSAPASMGYLLKAKTHGSKCPECVDPDTGTIFKDDCKTCFGSGFYKGYYAPYPCFYMDITNSGTDLKLVEQTGLTVDEPKAQLRFVNAPPVDPYDIWVDDQSDHRWQLRQIKSITKIGSLPVVCTAVGVRLGFDHPIYNFQINRGSAGQAVYLT